MHRAAQTVPLGRAGRGVESHRQPVAESAADGPQQCVPTRRTSLPSVVLMCSID